MRMAQLKQFIMLSVLGLLLSCQVKDSPQQASQNTNIEIPTIAEKTFKVCHEPRRLFCTREYAPVCAKLDTGIRCIKSPCPSDKYVTKPNTCTACADEKVSEYALGACPRTKIETKISE